jgi:hypothetical protein
VTTEAIQESEFLREFTRELRNKNVSVFAGAGLSMASGYVDWKGLLRDVIRDLRLDPNKEDDLVTVAQYHCNKASGNKTRLTQAILNHFGTTRSPTENHRILAALPIRTYWTTNYDKLIERSLEDAKKVPDVKYTVKQLAVTRPDRNAVVYKMHGDVDHAAEAVISKDDYEAYGSKMEPFVSALRGDLIEKTFLFCGFSFTDPNIDYILSRVRVQYEGNQRTHYCIQKRVSRNSSESISDFKYRRLKQDYFIGDLKRFGILTVLVNDYAGITQLLQKVAAAYKRSSIFISGAAVDFGGWSPVKATGFLHNLSYGIAAARNRIISGFGNGVGSAVLNGALAHLDEVGRTSTDEEVLLRPFPQIATGSKSLKTRWTEYRRDMICNAGLAIFVFGNKRDIAGNTILSDGMREEFDLCIDAGVKPLPIGATGQMAKVLWEEVYRDLRKHFPNTNAEFKKQFQKLGDATKRPDELISVVQKLIVELQKG